MTELVIAMLAMGACIYGTSSGGKLVRKKEYRAFRDAIAQTALAAGNPRAVAAILFGSEMTVAAALTSAMVLTIAGVRDSMTVAAVALGCGIALTSALIAGVTVVLRSGSRVTCACFGATSGRRISGSHLARNVGILALLLAGLIGNEFRQGRASAGATIVALAAGGLAGLLLIRFDDMVELFAPVRQDVVR